MEADANGQEAASQSESLTESLDSLARKPRSEQLKKLRELLMMKIEQNDFLYSLFSNPRLLSMNPSFGEEVRPFVFQPPVMDGSVLEFEVQYVAPEGPYVGKLYLSPEFILFKNYTFESQQRLEEYCTRYPFALHVSAPAHFLVDRLADQKEGEGVAAAGARASVQTAVLASASSMRAVHKGEEVLFLRIAAAGQAQGRGGVRGLLREVEGVQQEKQVQDRHRPLSLVCFQKAKVLHGKFRGYLL